MTIFRKHRKNLTDFTRQRKLGFKQILISVLISLKNSLTLEIDNFLEKLNVEEVISYTKQAYSEARKKLLPTAFIELNDILVEDVYCNDFKTFKGHRLIAVDGSTVELPNTKELKNKYGVFSKNAQFPAGRMCMTYDVLNEIILNGELMPYKESENEMANRLIPNVQQSSANDIFIFDRGFASIRLICMLNKLGKKYIFRVQRGFLKEINQFRDSTLNEQIVNIDINYRRIKTNRLKDINEPVQFNLRAARIKLESEDEILITNLSEEEANLKELGQLYNKRWGIEVNYHWLKNVYQIENFTGDSDITVQQDFHATIFITNMASLLIRDAQAEHDKSNKKNKQSIPKKINRRIAMGYFKRDLIHILLQDDPKVTTTLYDAYVKKLSKHVVPVRPNRKYPRTLSHNPKFGRTNKKVF